MEQLIKKCDCKEVIVGTSKSQLDYNFAQHLNGKKHLRRMNLGRFSKCVDCGNKVKYLHIHHINQDHSDKRLENEKVLCADCHYKLHKEIGFKKKGGSK